MAIPYRINGLWAVVVRGHLVLMRQVEHEGNMAAIGLALSGADYVAPPVAIPTQHGASDDHRAIEIPAIRHLAERASARAFGIAGGQATHGRRAHADMIVVRAAKAHGSA